MISIINYGTGNVISISNMLKRIGVESKIITKPEDLKNSDKIILPGIGTFDNAMKILNDRWIDELNHTILNKKKLILGICLGMQLMCKSSEEGILNGFGWIDADVIRFKFNDNNLKIPHMGWDYVNIIKENNLITDLRKPLKYYFVHSYHVKLNNPIFEIGQSHYGYSFTSAFQNENIFGVQFHPEKSHFYGLNLLKNFANL